MPDKVPSGWTAVEAGLLLKADTARSTATDRRRRKRAGLEVTQDPLLDWALTGTVPARQRGQDLFHDRSRQSMAEVIETIRERDPLLFRATDYHDKLAVGTGLTLSSDQPMILALADRIWEFNGFDELQHRIAIELFVTGDLMCEVPVTEANTIPGVNLIPSSQVKRITTRGDKPWYYHREWEDESFPDPQVGIQSGVRQVTGTKRLLFQDIMAEDLVHTVVNVGAKSIRGVSPLQAMAKWSSLYARGLESTILVSRMRAMLGFHAKLSGAGANDPQVKELRDAIDEQLVTYRDLSGMSYKSVPAGGWVVTSDDVEISNLGAEFSAHSMDAEIRRILLMAATAAGMPEYTLSDGANANLASSESQSNPFFKLMLTWQSIVIATHRNIFRLAFDRLMEHGVLNSVPLDEGMTHPIDHLVISGPDILSPNLAALAPVFTTAVQANMMSRRTAATRMGLDWDEELAQIEAEKELGLAVPASPTGPPSLPFFAAGEGEPGRRITMAEEDEPRHDETQDKMTQRRETMRKLTRAAFEAIRGSDGSQGRITEIMGKWREDMAAEFRLLMTEARAIGNSRGKAEAEAA